MPSHAVLVLAHKNLDYIYQLAKKQSDTNFYIHIDGKSNYICDFPVLSNFYILDNSVNVYWGSFSQVEATLNLLKIAFMDDSNQYFHLISAEDVLLVEFAEIEKQWQNSYHDQIMIECFDSKKHRYRTRFDTFHANKSWQRSILGKGLTKLNQLADVLVPTDGISFFGASWFSIQREQLSIVLDMQTSYQNFFRKKLCPDEHFFQKIVYEHLKDNIANSNMRFIIFDEMKNHPEYLNAKQLQEAKMKGAWFARKVNKNEALKFLKSDY